MLLTSMGDLSESVLPSKGLALVVIARGILGAAMFVTPSQTQHVESHLKLSSMAHTCVSFPEHVSRYLPMREIHA